jgi:hypothetical protein
MEVIVVTSKAQEKDTSGTILNVKVRTLLRMVLMVLVLIEESTDILIRNIAKAVERYMEK